MWHCCPSGLQAFQWRALEMKSEGPEIKCWGLQLWRLHYPQLHELPQVMTESFPAFPGDGLLQELCRNRLTHDLLA